MTSVCWISVLVFGLSPIILSLGNIRSSSVLQPDAGEIFYGKTKRNSGDPSSNDAGHPNSGNQKNKKGGSGKDSSSGDQSPEDPNKCKKGETLQCDPTYPYRTINGTCNNLDYPTWGSARQCYLRFQPSFYDGYGSFRKSTTGDSLPEPRDLTLNIFTNLHRPTRKVSFLFTLFGQLVAHDLSQARQNILSETCCPREDANKPDCIPILLRSNDPFYSRFNITCLELHRTEPCTACKTKNREQVNSETAALDASIVYGSDDDRASNLRANDGTGKLLSDDSKQGELLPNGTSPTDQFCPRNENSKCFIAGDGRVNQHTTLMILQTLEMREHNRLATILKQMNPHWDDERLYQEARRINIAEFQCITYKDYLPHLLGPYIVHQFDLTPKPGSDGSVYNPKARLGTWNEFAVASYRLHSMVATDVGTSHLRFKDLFSNPDLIRQGKLNQIVEGVCKVPSEEYDHWFVDDVVDYLYQQPGVPFGEDLSSIDMQRGRDHGLAPYIYLVKFCSGGQLDIRSFDDIPPELIPPKNIKLLKKNFASVQDVDLWVGIQMENHIQGSELGPTAACINAKQFYFLKFGDRFFFEHKGQVPSFTPAQRKSLKQCSFARILCDNSGVKRVQQNPFLLPSFQNPKLSCSKIPKVHLDPWKEITT